MGRNFNSELINELLYGSKDTKDAIDHDFERFAQLAKNMVDALMHYGFSREEAVDIYKVVLTCIKR